MLFFKECKKILRSLTFWIYCIIVILMFFSQYYADANNEAYPDGYKIVMDEEKIMNGALCGLLGEYSANYYVCYPYGFYKSVSLKEKDKHKIEEYLMELTDTDSEGLTKILKQGEQYTVVTGMVEHTMYEFKNMNVSSELQYSRFKEIMENVDDILGGGSSYQIEELAGNYSFQEMTPEEEAAEYDLFISNDKVTGALARLFSDYLGIDLAFLPVFVAAALVAADRRSKASDNIYSRKISSCRLVFTRYSALIVTMFVPIFITMIIALIQAIHIYNDKSINVLSMFAMPSFWLIPNIMTASAVGMFATEMFSAGAAIIIQAAWSFRSLMSEPLAGSIGKFDLICRHNTLFERDSFMAHYNDFVFNRIFYIILSIGIIGLTAVVFEMKRRGVFNGIRLFGKGGIFGRKA
ncbi:MAG: ABC transporter permease [Ruminococcus sp.]|nr:ABC transporter permease [Ruminococcus sp.]